MSQNNFAILMLHQWTQSSNNTAKKRQQYACVTTLSVDHCCSQVGEM
jgi:hypothetical protein